MSFEDVGHRLHFALQLAFNFPAKTNQNGGVRLRGAWIRHAYFALWVDNNSFDITKKGQQVKRNVHQVISFVHHIMRKLPYTMTKQCL